MIPQSYHVIPRWIKWYRTECSCSCYTEGWSRHTDSQKQRQTRNGTRTGWKYEYLDVYLCYYIGLLDCCSVVDYCSQKLWRLKLNMYWYQWLPHILILTSDICQVLDHTVNDEQRVAVCSLNVKDEFQVVRSNIQEAEDYIGKCVDVLVNCAGMMLLF